MSGTSANVPSDAVHFDSFVINLAQNAGLYTLCTASQSITIKSISFRVNTAGTGFTNFIVGTNDTGVVSLLGLTLLVSVTQGVNLPAYTGICQLAATKAITYTIVGNGSAGSVTAVVEYGGGILS